MPIESLETCAQIDRANFERRTSVPIAVVTGAAGFIGSHLVTRLLQAGYQVTMLDNLSSGHRENIAEALALAGDGAKAEFHEVDLAGSSNLLPYLKNADYVFHLAALADIVPSIEQPMKYHRSNVEGTVRLLDAIRNCTSIKKVVYAASSSCYGLPDIFPTPETAPIRPQYPYALTKTVAEQYMMHFSQVYDIPTVSLRFFNVYGPRVRTSGTYGAVFGVFLAQKLAGKPMTIVGDGRQTRDFIYVTDVAEALWLAAESKVQRDIFNVAAGHPQSVNRLCELIGGDTLHIPRRPGEPDCTWADIRKIQKHLDWNPTVSFEEGVANMLGKITAWKDAPVWTPKSIKEATKSWFKYLKDDSKVGATGGLTASATMKTT